MTDVQERTPATSAEPDAAGGEPELARDLGLFDIVVFGVGGLVGAGIYAIIGEAAAYGGSMLWLSFLVAASVAFLTAATYAELVSRYPDAGASFEYIKQAFGLRVATASSVLMLFTGVVAAGAIAISFSDYLSRLLDVPTVVTTLAVIALMGAVNAVGAAQASWFNIAATVVTLAGLAAIVVVSWEDLGSVDLLDTADVDLLGIGIGSALIFFSFIGFEDLVSLAEETKEARRNLPKGLLISSVIVLVIYLLVAVAAVSALGADDLAASSGPLAEIMSTKVGSIGATAIIAVALFATSKTILSNILGSSRLVYDVSRDVDSRVLDRVASVHGRTSTPLIAIAAVSVMAMVFGAIGNLRVVAAVSNILIMLLFVLVNCSLIRIRRTADQRDEDEPPFRIPGSIGNVPVTAVLAVVGILALLSLNVAALLGVG